LNTCVLEHCDRRFIRQVTFNIRHVDMIMWSATWLHGRWNCSNAKNCTWPDDVRPYF